MRSIAGFIERKVITFSICWQGFDNQKEMPLGEGLPFLPPSSAMKTHTQSHMHAQTNGAIRTATVKMTQEVNFLAL